MTAELEQLLATVRSRVSDPVKQELVARIAGDLAQLSVRALGGEDVEREVQHVRAQGALLAAGEAMAVSQALSDWATRIVGALVKAAIPAA